MADHWAEAEEISIDLKTLQKYPTWKCSRLIVWRIQALQYKSTIHIQHTNM